MTPIVPHVSPPNWILWMARVNRWDISFGLLVIAGYFWRVTAECSNL